MGDKSFSVSRRRIALAFAAAPVALLGLQSGAAAQANDLANDQAGEPVTRGAGAQPAASLAPRDSGFQPPGPKLAYFELAQVRLTGGPMLEARDANLAFIKRIDPDRLLHTFRLNAGLPSSAKPLGGWETPDCELRGHFTGHYLSAVSLGYAATGDADLKRRGDHMVAVLAECQQALGAGGYLSAFPMEEFDRLDARRQVWAPFYTVHKIMAGLLDMNMHAGNPQALLVVEGMAGWVDSWTAARTEAHMQAILDDEFGGMNEVLYNLGAVTGDRRWIGVGDRFTKARFITPLAERRDELRGLHMNTHVPQVIGAARRYELTGEPRFGQAANFFWDTVVDSRAYVTGGSSNREHWLTDPYRQGDEWDQAADHQECCCAYNMMKLTRDLHRLKPDVRRIDFYERNLLNHRLGTIQPGTGRTTYFLSVAPGAWKTLATDDDTFWCCTGTGIEEFSKISDTIYAHDGRGIYVNLFAPSELTWGERGVRLEQKTRFPDEARTTLVVHETPREAWPLRIRIPGWTTDQARVLVNGRALETVPEPGSYLQINRVWRPGDEVVVETPMTLTVEHFPDAPATQAFLYGPLVLAGQYPIADVPGDLIVNKQGPQVDHVKLAIPPLHAGGRPALDLLQPAAGQSMTYSVAGQAQPVVLKPLNQSWDRYNVYWNVV